MARLHLFEIEDQPWCPAWLRDAGTGYLRVAMERTGQLAAIAPLFTEALQKSGETRIVDLCSGGGGSIPGLVEHLRKQGSDVSATLTDLFPNRPALEAVKAESAGAIDFEPEPVDARAVPARLTGLRTLFNAFHHFRPADARAILARAAADRRPIAVFEVVERRPVMLLGMLFSPLAALAMMPLVKPRRPLALFFTYVVPLVPLFIMFDGVVSCLRIYSVRELKALVADIPAPDWEWEIRSQPLGVGPANATILLGRPVERIPAEAPRL